MALNTPFDPHPLDHKSSDTRTTKPLSSTHPLDEFYDDIPIEKMSFSQLEKACSKYLLPAFYTARAKVRRKQGWPWDVQTMRKFLEEHRK